MQMVTDGIVLRETVYKETDKILTVLTKDGGKQTVKARACRKNTSQLAASAQLLVYSELTLSERLGFWTVSAAESIEQFWGVKQDLEKLALACYCAEVTELIALEEQPDTGLLPLILNTLYALDKLQKPLPLVKAMFEARVLCLAGYAPQLGACCVCGKENPKDARLVLADGVLRCGSCGAGAFGASLSLDEVALAALRHAVYGDEKRLFTVAMTRKSLPLLAAASEQFLTTQLEKSFRTLDFYKSVLTP